MSGRGRSRNHGGGGRGHGRGRGSGRSSHQSRNDNGNGDNNNRTEKVEFTPHCAGKTQGATHDSVKKQITHDIRSKSEFGNDLAELLEKEM